MQLGVGIGITKGSWSVADSGPAGTTFTEQWGDGSRLAWIGGPENNTQTWLVVAGSPAIAASPAGATPHTAAARSLHTTAAAQVRTNGSFPLIPAGTTFDVYAYVYSASTTGESFKPWIRFINLPGGAIVGEIGLTNNGGTFEVFGSDASGSFSARSAMSLNAWHLIKLHIQSGSGNSYMQLDGGTQRTFTCGANICNTIQVFGYASTDLYVGHMYMDCASVPASFPPTVLMDCAGAASGNAPTVATLNAATHGRNAAWTIGEDPISGIIYSDAQSQALLTPVTVGGIAYAGDTGLSLRYDKSSDNTTSCTYGFQTSSPNVSAGFWFRTNAAGTEFKQFDISRLRGASNDTSILVMQTDGSLRIQLEYYPTAYAGSVTIAADTWYWITHDYRQGATHRYAVYSAAGVLLGSGEAAAAAGTPEAPASFAIGHVGGELAISTTYMYYANIVLDTALGTFPLLP